MNERKLDRHDIDERRDAGRPCATTSSPRRSARRRATGRASLRPHRFMRVLSRRFEESWQDRIANIHPSLLPLFRPEDA
jgi:hypothetical protein